jgi:hypothetical protein
MANSVDEIVIDLLLAHLNIIIMANPVCRCDEGATCRLDPAVPLMIIINSSRSAHTAHFR